MNFRISFPWLGCKGNPGMTGTGQLRDSSLSLATMSGRDVRSEEILKAGHEHRSFGHSPQPPEARLPSAMRCSRTAFAGQYPWVITQNTLLHITKYQNKQTNKEDSKKNH